MMPFFYKYQNPSGFACLMLIRAIVIFYPTANTKFKQEERKKLACGSLSQMMPLEKLPFGHKQFGHN